MERPASSGMPDSLIALSKRDWVDPLCDYWLIDDEGKVIEYFRIANWSIDDELGGTLFAIEDHRLIEIVVRDWFQGEKEFKERIAIAALAPATDDEARAQAERAIARDRVGAAERVRQGALRVAAIAGAQVDYRAGEAFRAAQRVLRDRVSRYGEKLSEELLRALICFGSLHSKEPSIAPALNVFAYACRRAAFDRTLPYGEAAPTATALKNIEDKTALTELNTLLSSLETALNAEAETQELADANQNAAAFFTAARETARARALIQAQLEA